MQQSTLFDHLVGAGEQRPIDVGSTAALRSLAVLVSADTLVRLLSLPIPVSRRRVQATNSILLSLALQPLAVLVAVVYLMQFNLFSTKHETFVSVSLPLGYFAAGFGRIASAVPWMKAVILSRSSSFSLPVKSGMPWALNGPLKAMSFRFASSLAGM